MSRHRALCSLIMPPPPVAKKFYKELTAGSTLYSVRWGDVARAGAPVVLQVSPLHYCLLCVVFNGVGNTFLLPVTQVVTSPISALYGVHKLAYQEYLVVYRQKRGFGEKGVCGMYRWLLMYNAQCMHA